MDSIHANLPLVQPPPIKPTAFGRSVSNPAAGAGPAGGRAAQALPMGANVKTALAARTASIATTQPGATLPVIIKEYGDAWQGAINDAQATLPKNQQVAPDSILLDNPLNAAAPYLQPGFIIGNFDAFPTDHQALLLKDLSHMASNNSLPQSTRWEAAMGFCLYSTDNAAKKDTLRALLNDLNHATPEYRQALAAYNADDLVGCLDAMATPENCAYMQQFGKYLPADAGVANLVSILSARAPKGAAYISIANTNAIAFSIPPGTPPSRSGGALMLANLANRLHGYLPASVARASARTILDAPAPVPPTTEDTARRDRAKQVIDAQVYKIMADPNLAQTKKGTHEFLDKLLPLLEKPSTPTKQYTLVALLKAADNTVQGEYPIHDPLRLSQLSAAQTKLLFDAIGENIPVAAPNDTQATKDLRKTIVDGLVNRMMDKGLKSTAWGSQAIDAFWDTPSLTQHAEVFDVIKANAFNIKTGTGHDQFSRNPGYGRALGEVLKAASPTDRDALIKQMAGLLIDTRMKIEQAACFTDALEAAKPDAYKGIPLDNIPNGDPATLRRHLNTGMASWTPAARETTRLTLSSWKINLEYLPPASPRPANTAAAPAIVSPAVPSYGHFSNVPQQHTEGPEDLASRRVDVRDTAHSNQDTPLANQNQGSHTDFFGPAVEDEDTLPSATSKGQSASLTDTTTRVIFGDNPTLSPIKHKPNTFLPYSRSERPTQSSSNPIASASTDASSTRRPAPERPERTVPDLNLGIPFPLATPEIDTTPLPKVADTIAKFGGKGSFGRQPLERGNVAETVIVNDPSVSPSRATLSAPTGSSVNDDALASGPLNVSANSIIEPMNNASQVFDNALEDFISAPEDTSPSLLPSLLKAAKAFAAATTNMIDMLKQIPEDAASAAQSNAKAAEDALKAFLDACNSFAPAADNETVTPTAADLEAIKRSGNNALAAANAAIDSTNLIAQGGVKGRIAFFEAEARRNAPKV